MELAVSVAVIAVLIAIAVPLFAKFQAKSRQIEAKASLANLYAAEHNFFIQFNQYTVNLNNAGFGALGKGLRYATGFDANGTGVPCTSYSPDDGAPPELVESGNMKFVWNCHESINKSGQTFDLPMEWSTENGYCKLQPKLPAGTITNCDASRGKASFRAAAVGDPKNKIGPLSNDGWTVDDQKIFLNSSPGL